jgi:hypothetical protein
VSFTVNPPSTVNLNAAMTPSPKVLVRESSPSSTPVAGAVVHLTINNGGSLSCADQTTDANGVATFSSCAVSSGGGTNYKLTASPTTGTGSADSTTFTVVGSLSATGAPTAGGTTYFQCSGGTGHFGAPMTFHVTGIPTGTNGATNVRLTVFSTVVKTVATGNAATVDIPMATSETAACSNPTNQAANIPFKVEALSSGGAVVAQTSNATVHVSTFDS